MTSEVIEKIGLKPPHPGVFIREEVLEPLHLSVAAAAQALGVRRATLSDLANGRAALSPEMALRIEKAFGVDMEALLKMQAWFDTCAMRDRTEEFAVPRFRQVTPAGD